MHCPETLRPEAFVKRNCSRRNPKFLGTFASGLTTRQGSVSTSGVSSSYYIPLALPQTLSFHSSCALLRTPAGHPQHRPKQGGTSLKSQKAALVLWALANDPAETALSNLEMG